MPPNKSSKPTVSLSDDERDYCAEMGFDWAERDAYLQRKADAIQSEEMVSALPCGHLSHENGGPSDYDCAAKATQGGPLTMTKRISDLEGRLNAALKRGDHKPAGGLSKQEADALRAVKGGADVYDRGMAVTLRGLEKRGLVHIVKAVMPPSGEQRQPYFGAITTKAGIAAISKATQGER